MHMSVLKTPLSTGHRRPAAPVWLSKHTSLQKPQVWSSTARGQRGASLGRRRPYALTPRRNAVCEVLEVGRSRLGTGYRAAYLSRAAPMTSIWRVSIMLIFMPSPNEFLVFSYLGQRSRNLIVCRVHFERRRIRHLQWVASLILATSHISSLKHILTFAALRTKSSSPQFIANHHDASGHHVDARYFAESVGQDHVHHVFPIEITVMLTMRQSSLRLLGFMHASDGEDALRRR